jgi:hypothetical protein
MGPASESGLPPRVRKKKPVERRAAPAAEEPGTPARTKPDDHGRVMSYVFGVFLFLLGGGMLIGYDYLQRAPSKVFNLLMAGGVGALLCGIGLCARPLNEEQLDVFQNDPNPISVFKVMPIFWKIWMLVILAAMIGAFVYVAQNTVRIGR